MPRILLSTFTALLFSAVGFLVLRQSIYKEAFIYVCNKVEVKSLFMVNSIEEWGERCRAKAQSQWRWSKASLLREIQIELNALGISHLRVYGPIEDKVMWEGKGKDTGLRTWEMDGRFVVSEVLEKSSAEEAGVRIGDEILYIADQAPRSRWDIQQKEGLFYFRRKGVVFSKYLEAKEIRLDSRPKLQTLSENLGYLKIQSFRPEYFDSEFWKEFAQGLDAYGSLIIDLRDNGGGNFVAMLRGLSPLFCEAGVVGKLIQPRRQSESYSSQFFEDRLDEKYQLQHIERFEEIPLVTFNSYGCFEGPVVVLVNSRTSSVAEIFAHALKERSQTWVLGQQTSGDVVLAVWYDIPALGKEYSLSIPEALYVDNQGETLEGKGIWPDEVLFYDLNQALEGLDSWLSKAKSYIVQ